MTIRYHVFGLEFTMPKETIEQKIKEMGVEEFKKFAQKFYKGCTGRTDRSWWDSEEKWRQYEDEGLIRREGPTSLLWDRDRLTCFIETVHLAL